MEMSFSLNKSHAVNRRKFMLNTVKSISALALLGLKHAFASENGLTQKKQMTVQKIHQSYFKRRWIDACKRYCGYD